MNIWVYIYFSEIGELEGKRWWGTWPICLAGVDNARKWQVDLVRGKQVVVGNEGAKH